MVELRWVLFGLGAVLLLGVYLWGRGVLQRFVPRRALARRWLPSRPELALPDEGPPADSGAAAESNTAGEEATGSRAAPRPERVITVRFIPKNKQLSGERAVLALRSAGLQHGRYGIFHRLGDHSGSEALFSVASLTEPGSFDLTNLGKAIPGMSFFMVLPGPGDPVTCFDMMVETARMLAHDLDAELHDERGSSWSIQRERYVREEIIEYRHQHSHA